MFCLDEDVQCDAVAIRELCESCDSCDDLAMQSKRAAHLH